MNPRERGGVESRWASIGLPVLATSSAVGLWWLATIVFEIRPFLLPSPPDVVDALLRLPDYLAKSAWATLTEIVGGFALAVVVGLLTGALLAASRITEHAALPLLVASNAVPKLAVAPLLIVWMGFGTAPKVVMVFLISVFPIVIAAMSGLLSTPADLDELARSMAASRWHTYLKVRIPWALPQIFVGLKVAIALAVVGAVVGEFAGGNQGLGYIILSAGASADTALAFAAITVLAVLGIGLFYLLALVERLMLPWSHRV